MTQRLTKSERVGNIKNVREGDKESEIEKDKEHERGR